LFWVLPVYTPGGSEWGANMVLPLWYVRTYLWFLLLSPALLWLWRRWPLRTLAAPLVILVAYSFGLVVPNGSRTDEVALALSTFGACWILGFAHHDGSLRRLPVSRVVPLALTLLAAGAAWAATHPLPDLGRNIDNVPLANGMYCLGFVLLLLRFYPDFSWLARRRVLDTLVSALNARAMTVYLWGNVAGAGAIALEHRYGAGNWYAYGQEGLSRTVQYVLVWSLLFAVVLALGWIEDVAARRPARLLPWRTPRRRAAAPAEPATTPRARQVRHRHRRRTAPPVAVSAPVAASLVIDLRDGRTAQAYLR
jgi:hypothetical protein